MLLEILEPIRQIVTQPPWLFVPASILPADADGDKMGACPTHRHTKITGASRCDVDDWALAYLDKPQPSVKFRGPMPEKVVFA